jgi:N-acyl-D-amino-acid deacylase
MGTDPATFTLDVLAASNLEVSAIVKVRHQRSYDDLAKLFTHRAHVAGSDGIYIGKHTHPRAWGTFAKYLRVFTRERGDYSWSDIAVHLSGRTAERFCLGDRGRLSPGYAADVVIIDPATVADQADYDSPRRDAVGIDDVFVGGQQVLAQGRLTGVLSGSGLRRSAPVR